MPSGLVSHVRCGGPCGAIAALPGPDSASSGCSTDGAAAAAPATNVVQPDDASHCSNMIEVFL